MIYLALLILGLFGLGASGASIAPSGGGAPVQGPGPTTPYPLFDPSRPKANRFDPWFDQYGAQYGVSPLWMKAICLNESNMGSDASVQAGGISADGLSKGIMQLTQSAAGDYQPGIQLDELNSAELSINIACQLMATIQRSFDVVDARYTEWCIKSYNRGVARTQQERDGDPKGLAEPGFSNGNTYWTRWQSNFASLGGVL